MSIKPWVKLVIAAVAGFAGGGVTGYFVRKKTAEREFEICPEDYEKAEELLEKEDEEEVEDIPLITRPESIQQIIDRHFDEAEGGNGLVQLDTQKVAYFMQAKPSLSEIMNKYDTATKDAGGDVDGDEFDEQFIKDIADAEEDVVQTNGKDIDPANVDDWNRWTSVQDGLYEPIKLSWYDQDDILTDENDDPVENPEKFVGPDVSEYWRIAGDDTSDDPDIRYVYNHKQKLIYEISRIHASYAKKKKMEEYGGDDDGDDRTDWIRSRV